MEIIHKNYARFVPMILCFQASFFVWRFLGYLFDDILAILNLEDITDCGERIKNNDMESWQ